MTRPNLAAHLRSSTKGLPDRRAIAALLVGGCVVLLISSHYGPKHRRAEVVLGLVSFTGSPDAQSGGFGGFFRLKNSTSRAVEIPVFTSQIRGRLEAAKPSFEILQDSGWVPLFVGYDFVPETYRVPPGSELSVWVNLGRLASPNGIVKRGIGDLESQIAGVPYPFTARIQIGQTYSEPFEVAGKKDAAGRKKGLHD